MKRLGTVALLLPALLLLLITFVLPLLRLLRLSFSDPAGPLVPYAHLLGDEVYLRVFANTLLIAFVTTAISLLVSYPMAMVMVQGVGELAGRVVRLHPAAAMDQRSGADVRLAAAART